MMKKQFWMFLFILGIAGCLVGQGNVSVVLSGNKLLFSTEGIFGLGGEILEEDAALLALMKARYASVQNAVSYLMKNPQVVPLKNEAQGAALTTGLITIEEENPGKKYINGQQCYSNKYVMTLDLNTMRQRYSQIQKQPWFMKSLQMDYDRFASLCMQLEKIESQTTPVEFSKIQAIVKQLKASEWAFKGLQLKNAAAQVQQFDQALVLDPDYAFARLQRGKAYQRMKAYEKALQDFNWLIQRYPNWIEAFHARGVTSGLMENYDQVIQDFQKVLQSDPACVSALINRGIAYSKTDQLDAALADYQKALEIEPGHVVANYNSACIYALRGDVSAALGAIESALKSGFSDLDAIRNDEDLKSLHGNQAFEDLLSQYKKTTLE